MIFDLDDTLIDTTGSIFPFVIRNAVALMQQVGLSICDVDESAKILSQMNVELGNFHDALTVFLKEKMKVRLNFETLYQAGLHAVYDAPNFGNCVMPMPGAIDLLKKWSCIHRLFLVSKGEKTQQLAKLDLAGIPKCLFERIYICEKWNKIESYSEINSLRKNPEESVLVCGDRIYRDLTPAKELGYITVHILHGRGLGNTGSKRDVDYTISKLDELCAILTSCSLYKKASYDQN